MVGTLSRAFEEASRLPEAEQVDLAESILESIASRKHSAEAYEEHQTVQGHLAEDTTVDYSAYRKDHRFVVDEDGKRQSVVVPIEDYLQMLEDMQDLALIAERNDEPTEPLDAVLERLRKSEKER